MPMYSSVGAFKVKYMQELRDKGIEIYAAYGNTGTDVKAYEAVGIPKERCAALPVASSYCTAVLVCYCAGCKAAPAFCPLQCTASTSTFACRLPAVLVVLAVCHPILRSVTSV